MKRPAARLLMLLVSLCLLAACGQKGVSHEAPMPPAIRSLTVTRWVEELTPVGDAEPWGRYWYDPDRIEADLSHAPGLAYSLVVGNNTVFSGGLPEGYDLQELIEWGKDPGLNVDILHAHGFTGKGAVIAYIDQGVLPHREYDRENIHITNTGNYPLSMHGPAVLSLLAGETIGVAPDAEIYYLGCDSGDGYSQLHEADCLYRVIDLNETLPEGQKIRMVAFSDNIDPSEPYVEEFRAAARACEEAGVMVWFCGENGAVTFLPWAEKNDPRNLMLDQWGGGRPSLVYVPSSGRTTACKFDPANYVYYPTGGLSWTMPYTMGLYAIALSIDPVLTQKELRSRIVSTAYPFQEEKRLVNPVGFVAAALERVGRNEEADALRAEAQARQRYLYAVLDMKNTSNQDQRAIYNALAWITEARVMAVDASRFANGEELYAAVEADVRERGGVLAGFQLFGNVPPPEGDGEEPPVWRLNLEPGEYVAFFRDYLEAARAGEPDILAEGVLFPPNRAGMALSSAEGTLGQ
ncbi:MAG: hypothetical protein IKX47_02345 [Oscillospiraceae bacterium]|nr:hypothetical protein [Oscillospiraceae bacterium]